MDKVTTFFTELMRKYLPDPFVFCICLTLLTVVMAIVIQGKAPIELTDSWGKGFWSLLAFTTQVVVMLAMGYVLATAPLTDRLLDKITDQVSTPRGAIIVATLIGAVGSYLNWAFGLVIGGIIAKKLALKIRGVHYPLIIASAYSGFSLYGLGFSATIPVLISTAKHPLEPQMGVVPLSETIFSPAMLLVSLVLVVTLPFVNASLQPKDPSKIIEVDPNIDKADAPKTGGEVAEENTVAAKLNNSRLLSLLICVMALAYGGKYFYDGKNLDLNVINFIILFLGIFLLGTPARYVAKLSEGIKTVAGILLQYPFYAGIMAMMASSGLVVTISKVFVDISTPATLPFWGLISSYFINFFAPSGGGHWVIQGPFMMDAAISLKSSLGQNAMAVMLGNAWNDLVQPFWILPALAISKLRLRDVMGYTVVMMFWVGIVVCSAVLIWGAMGH